MKGPAFPGAALTGFGIAVAAGAGFSALAPLAGADATLRIMIPLATLAWLVCLRPRDKTSAGQVTVLALWCMVSAATWLLAPPIGVHVLVHAGLLWIARALFFYSGVLPALVDMALSALSLSAAVWALTRSGSVFLAAWSFFLLQALFVFIPRHVAPPRAAEAGNDQQVFERARMRADAALRQLFTR